MPTISPLNFRFFRIPALGEADGEYIRGIWTGRKLGLLAEGTVFVGGGDAVAFVFSSTEAAATASSLSTISNKVGFNIDLAGEMRSSSTLPWAAGFKVVNFFFACNVVLGAKRRDRSRISDARDLCFAAEVGVSGISID